MAIESRKQLVRARYWFTDRIPTLLAAAGFLVLWQAVAMLIDNNRIFAYPEFTWQSIVQRSDTVFVRIVETFSSVIVAFVLAVLFGVALGLVIAAILAYGYPALGAIYTFEAGFNAADRSKVSFVSTLLQYGGVRLPIAAAGVLSLTVGVTAVFWAVTISNVGAALWLAAYYRYSVHAASATSDSSVSVGSAAA